MDYEQKYKEALKRAREIHNEHKAQPFNIMTKVFPELKESEDERIRKEIISALKWANHKGVYDKHIAWLEKQREQTNLPQFTFDDVLALQCCMETVKKVQEDKDLYEKLKDLHGRVYDAYHFEKQGESDIEEPNFFDDFRKTDSEVEPKFKVGDWITNGDYTWKIEDVKPLDYILQSQDGNIVDDTISHVDEHLHLWTIQDAKDGDVLINWNNTAFIFKTIEDETVKFHIAYNEKWDAIKTPSNELSHLGLPEPQFEFHPTTKEQRDLLFQKMKEAGYEWDKQEKRPIKVPKIKEETGVLKQLIDEEKHDWSEEDEQYLLVCKNALKKYEVSDKWDSNIIIRWLENRLKEKNLFLHNNKDD